MKFILVSFIVLLPLLTFAQMNFDEGYIVDVNDVKIVGKIRSSTPAMYSTRITFKNAKTDEVTNYRPSDIKSWHIPKNDIVYESKNYKINSRKGYTVFMRRLCDGKGKAKLYEYYNTDGEFGFTQTFIEKDGEMKEVLFGRFRKNMAEMFSDHEELAKDIKAKKYKKKDILDIIAEYNRWREYQWK